MKLNYSQASRFQSMLYSSLFFFLFILSACDKSDEPLPKFIEANASLHNLISGGQLVVYSRSSYVSDNLASSITYYNFCTNGTFNIATDASYSIDGGGAYGSNQSSQYGQWEVEEYQNMITVKMSYADGDVIYNPIDEERLRSGGWRQGNTQYAFQQGRAVCR